MKKLKIILLVVCLLYFAACDQPIGLDGAINPETIDTLYGEYTLRIVNAMERNSPNSSVRTILPAVSEDSFEWYRLAFTDTETSQQVSSFCQPGSLTVTIEAGVYNLTVTAYKDSAAKDADTPAAIGELQVTIIAGQKTAGEVVLYAIEEGAGFFRWNIVLPNGLEEAYIEITPKEDTETAFEEAFGSSKPLIFCFIGGSEQTANPGEVELPSGCYGVILTISKVEFQTVHWRETLQIYQNLTSCFDYDFTNYNFAVIPPTKGALDFSITFSRFADDEVLSWDVPSSAIAIAHTAGESITFALNEFSQYSLIEWYVNGIFKTNDACYVLNPADFTAADKGSHSLTVETVLSAPANAASGRKWYNRTIQFEVRDDFSGDGTEETPFLIATAAGLRELAEKVNSSAVYGQDALSYADAHYRMIANIDLNGEEWLPIGTYANRFFGVFDGGGFTITGLHITAGVTDQGLFGVIGRGGAVRCLGVNGIVSGGSNNGGIAGSSFGTVENCYSTVTITGGSYSGGIVGWNRTYSSIINCYSTGSVFGSGNAGGITGYNSRTVRNCVSLGLTVDGGENTGRVIGGGSGTSSNNKARADMLVNSDTIADSNSNANGKEGLSIEMNGTATLAGVFNGWDRNVWFIPEGYLISGGELPGLKMNNEK